MARTVAAVVTVGTTVVTAATATTAILAVATLTARSRGLLILKARNGQADLAAVVDALHDHLNGVAFLEHVLDGVAIRSPLARLRICEMCSRPSVPGVRFTNAPKLVVLTTLPL